jgi:hypothetical protein
VIPGTSISQTPENPVTKLRYDYSGAGFADVKMTLPNGPRADHAGIDLLAVVVNDMSCFLIAPVRQLLALFSISGITLWHNIVVRLSNNGDI